MSNNYRGGDKRRIKDFLGHIVVPGDTIVYARKASTEIEMHRGFVNRVEYNLDGSDRYIEVSRSDGRLVRLTNPACFIVPKV